MKMNHTSRRELLVSAAATTAALATWSSCAALGGGSAQSWGRRRFGATDMHVNVLGFGGAEIGYQKAEPAVVGKLLNGAIDAGLNVIDTAECYLESEVLIGNAIAHRRREVFLFTKCGHTSQAPAVGPDWSKDGVLASIERSLERLRTDTLDVVHLHSCSLEELQKGDCIAGLEQAKKQGKVRYIGYSGDSQAARWAISSGHFDSLQTSVNICDQECIELTLPLAAERNMGVIAKRPIANAVWRYDAEPPSAYHHEYWRRLQDLAFEFTRGERAQDPGPDGAAGIAMRFTAMQPAVDVLIVGTTNPDRWAQNAGLLGAGALSKAQHDAIRQRWREIAKPEWVGQT